MASSSQLPQVEASTSSASTSAPESLPRALVSKLEQNAQKNWDKWWKIHETRFFRDRHWTDREFGALREPVEAGGPQKKSGGGALGDDTLQDDDEAADLVEHRLAAAYSSSTSASAPAPVLLEVGCGVGNMVWPLLDKMPTLKVHCCDFSARAIELLKQHPRYDSSRVHAFVWDITRHEQPYVGDDGSTTSTSLHSLISSHSFGMPTLVSSVFLLSAIPPSLHLPTMTTLFSLFAPSNGPATLLFRDYARGDLAESRFSVRKRAWDEPHLLSAEGLPHYRRGDGTMTFFFDEEYLRPIAQEAIAAQERAEAAGWNEELGIVERVGENRKKGLTLTRRFLQGCWTRREQQ